MTEVKGTTLETINLLVKKGLYDSQSTLYNNGVIMRINNDKGLIILSSRKQRNKYREIRSGSDKLDTKEHVEFLKEYNIYFAECNGLILDSESFNPICVPPKVMTKTIDVNLMSYYMQPQNNLYKVYEAKDGTTYNIYWRGRWIISTTNSLDIENIVWNNKSFRTCLLECVGDIYRDLGEMFEGLDKNYCYSIGISHPELHPISQKEIWFIQRVCLDINSVNYLIADYSQPAEIKIKCQPEIRVNNFNEMLNMCHNAYNEYKLNGTKRFGFIAKSLCPEITGGYTHLFVQSTLYNRLIIDYYNWKFTKESRDHEYNRFYYVMLWNFLNNKKRFDFFNVLFPCFKVYETAFTKFSGLIVDRIHEFLVNDKKMEDVVVMEPILGNAVKIKENLESKDLDEIAYCMINKIKKDTKNMAKCMILDFVENLENLDLLYRYFFKKSV